MIKVPDQIVKNLLEVLDDVGWYLRQHRDLQGEYDASDLLVRLRKAKHDFENNAVKSTEEKGKAGTE